MGAKRVWVMVGVALAAAAGSTAADEPIRVYTNADLPKYEAQEAPAAAPPSEDQSGWAFVREFLDRQYAQLDSERRDRIERLELESRAEEPEPGYGVPYLGVGYGYYGYGVGYGPPVKDRPSCAPSPHERGPDVPFRGAGPRQPRPSPARAERTVRRAR